MCYFVYLWCIATFMKHGHLPRPTMTGGDELMDEMQYVVDGGAKRPC